MKDKFSYYDFITTLVPGVIFSALLIFTLQYYIGKAIFNWQGGFGDATLLVIFGYGIGVILQTLGTMIERWAFDLTGGQPFAKVLLDESKLLSAELKSKIKNKLNSDFGLLPQPHEPDYTEAKYIFALNEKAYQAYDKAKGQDAEILTYLAVYHQMRGYVICFLLLTITSVGEFAFRFNKNADISKEKLCLFFVFLVFTFFFYWRMFDKAYTLSKKALVRFISI